MITGKYVPPTEQQLDDILRKHREEVNAIRRSLNYRIDDLASQLEIERSKAKNLLATLKKIKTNLQAAENTIMAAREAGIVFD